MYHLIEASKTQKIHSIFVLLMSCACVCNVNCVIGCHPQLAMCHNCINFQHVTIFDIIHLMFTLLYPLYIQ